MPTVGDEKVTKVTFQEVLAAAIGGTSPRIKRRYGVLTGPELQAEEARPPITTSMK
jgi:hypothetical protein